MSINEKMSFREENGYMNSFYERSPFKVFKVTGSLKIDVYETDKDIILKAEMFGMSKEDLNLNVNRNFIRLSGDRGKRSKEKGIKFHKYSNDRFSRTIPLHVEVKAEEAHTEYRDGILSVTVPKA